MNEKMTDSTPVKKLETAELLEHLGEARERHTNIAKKLLEAMGGSFYAIFVHGHRACGGPIISDKKFYGNAQETEQIMTDIDDYHIKKEARVGEVSPVPANCSAYLAHDGKSVMIRFANLSGYEQNLQEVPVEIPLKLYIGEKNGSVLSDYKPKEFGGIEYALFRTKEEAMAWAKAKVEKPE
jgi:hypothetical protein